MISFSFPSSTFVINSRFPPFLDFKPKISIYLISSFVRSCPSHIMLNESFFAKWFPCSLAGIYIRLNFERIITSPDLKIRRILKSRQALKIKKTSLEFIHTPRIERSMFLKHSNSRCLDLIIM